jgi:hypothetical protein
MRAQPSPAPRVTPGAASDNVCPLRALNMIAVLTLKWTLLANSGLESARAPSAADRTGHDRRLGPVVVAGRLPATTTTTLLAYSGSCG